MQDAFSNLAQKIGSERAINKQPNNIGYGEAMDTPSIMLEISSPSQAKSNAWPGSALK
jgi:hypothetical protein